MEAPQLVSPGDLFFAGFDLRGSIDEWEKSETLTLFSALI
jgi:hypothetical protein